MHTEAVRFRYENAFFVERPPRGRFEQVCFVIQDPHLIDENGRYRGTFGRDASGQIFFGLDESKNLMVYYQCPAHNAGPGVTFVLVQGAAVYRNWSQFPRSDTFDCIE